MHLIVIEIYSVKHSNGNMLLPILQITLSTLKKIQKQINAFYGNLGVLNTNLKSDFGYQTKIF